MIVKRILLLLKISKPILTIYEKTPLTPINRYHYFRLLRN